MPIDECRKAFEAEMTHVGLGIKSDENKNYYDVNVAVAWDGWRRAWRFRDAIHAPSQDMVESMAKRAFFEGAHCLALGQKPGEAWDTSNTKAALAAMEGK